MFSTSLLLFVYLSATVFALPAGDSSSRDGSSASCAAAKPTDILSFFITNYLAFAFTVRSVPGVKLPQTIRAAINALLFPFAGIARGCEAIGQAKRRGDSDLAHMARAGVLCTVVRGPCWRPRPGQVIRGCRLASTEQRCGIITLEDGPHDTVALYQSGIITRNGYDIFGQISDDLEAKGYVLRLLHPESKVEPLLNHESLFVASSSHSCLVKGFIAIFQLISACVTLYSTSDGAIAQYGYAAYGLTVVPYAVMSLINLAAQVACPEYPALFLVRSPIMDEAEQVGVSFSGVIGIIAEDDNDEVKAKGDPNSYHDVLVEKVETCERSVVVTYSLLSEEQHQVADQEHTPLKDGTTVSQSSHLLADLQRIAEGKETDEMYEVYDIVDWMTGNKSRLPSENRLLNAHEEWQRRRLSGRAWSRGDAIAVSFCYTNLIVPLLCLLVEPAALRSVAKRMTGRLAGLGRAFAAPGLVVLISLVGFKPKHSLPSGAKDTWALLDLKRQNPLGVPILDRYDRESRNGSGRWPRIIAGILRVAGLAAPYAIIGALSGFHASQSTYAQRVWILIWLVFGQIFGVWTSLIESFDIFGLLQSRRWLLLITFVNAIVYGVPAIGGMVVVAQQLVSFGICGGGSS